ncbi:MAG: histidinol dehydrogenase, partial [Acidimicrobiales bacterium]
MLKRLDLRGLDLSVDPAGALPRPDIAGDGPREAVRDIIDRVRAGGDQVLLELTETFDRVRLERLRVGEAELQAAVDGLAPELRAAMEVSIEGIEDFHRHQLRDPQLIERDGLTIRAYQRPIRRAGLYVPGGRAEYPSTVLM